MINPSEIPEISGDMDAVSRHGTALKTKGAALKTAGRDVVTTWTGLAAHYTAPESAELFAAMDPVEDGTSTVGGQLETVGAALVTFADTVRPIQTQLSSLKSQAQQFTASVKDDDDWESDGDKVDEHNGLLHSVSAQMAALMAAERACANSINAVYCGTHWVADNADGTQAANEYGYSKDQLNQAADSDDGVPWGSTQERDKPWWEDAGGMVASYAKGVYSDGLMGDIHGLGQMVGFGGVDGLKQSWGGLAKLGMSLNLPMLAINSFVGTPGLPKGTLATTLKDTGKALVAWDTWKEDPARAMGNVSYSVVSIVFGTKGTGAALKSGKLGGTVARVSIEVSEVTAKIRAAVIPEFKLPEWAKSVEVHAYSDDVKVPNHSSLDANLSKAPNGETAHEMREQPHSHVQNDQPSISVDGHPDRESIAHDAGTDRAPASETAADHHETQRESHVGASGQSDVEHAEGDSPSATSGPQPAHESTAIDNTDAGSHPTSNHDPVVLNDKQFAYRGTDGELMKAQSQIRGRIGDDLTQALASHQGSETVASQIKIEGPGGNNIVADRIVRESDQLHVIEVKTGNSPLSDNQKIELPKLLEKAEIAAGTRPMFPRGTDISEQLASVRVERWNIDSLSKEMRETLGNYSVQAVYDGDAGALRSAQLKDWMISPGHLEVTTLASRGAKQ